MRETNSDAAHAYVNVKKVVLEISNAYTTLYTFSIKEAFNPNARYFRAFIDRIIRKFEEVARVISSQCLTDDEFPSEQKHAGYSELLNIHIDLA